MRGDVSILSISSISNRDCGSSFYPVRVANGDIYIIYGSLADRDLYWIKSTDGGITWSVPASILAGTMVGVSVWYDRWTPGDIGNKIHIWCIDTATHDVIYDNLDTSNDTLNGNVQVFNGVSANGNQNTCLSGAKSRGGNLYIGFDIDGGTETGFYRSTDSGATWAARTDIHEAASDYYKVFPDNAADNQDMIVFFWDRSANELSVKSYDDSANTVGETSVSTLMVNQAHNVICSQFDGSVRLSDGILFVVAWSNRDTATAKLRIWEINTASSITERTNVVSSSTDDQQGCSLSIDTDENIYVYYMGLTDGSETVGTSLSINYKKTTDGAVTFGAETGLSQFNRNYSLLCSAKHIGAKHVVLYSAMVNNLLDPVMSHQIRTVNLLEGKL